MVGVSYSEVFSSFTFDDEIGSFWTYRIADCPIQGTNDSEKCAMPTLGSKGHVESVRAVASVPLGMRTAKFEKILLQLYCRLDDEFGYPLFSQPIVTLWTSECDRKLQNFYTILMIL